MSIDSISVCAEVIQEMTAGWIDAGHAIRWSKHKRSGCLLTDGISFFLHCIR